METKEENKEFQAINIEPDRRRFSDCCNAELLPSKQCPKCGRQVLDLNRETMRIPELRGMDGKQAHNPKGKEVIVSMVDDTPKKDDKMPRRFKDMQERGIKILSWSDTSI